MDGSSSDHSRAVSENTNGLWNWDTEDVSISRLHLGDPEPSEDLQDLVEDKEIAACAVAFVVNGTRRGIVPLCADVASLMRSKRRLEKRVIRLKREVEALRRVSQHAGHSLSPTPTSVHSYSSSRGSFMDPAHVQVFNELLRGAQCSDVTSHSSDSSQIGSSPTPHRRSRGTLHRTTACVPVRSHLTPSSIHRSVGDVRTDDGLEVYEGGTDNSMTASHKSSPCVDEVDLSADSALHFDSGIENGSLNGRAADAHSLPDADGNPVLMNSNVGKSASDDRNANASNSGCCCGNATASGMSLEDRFNKSMEANMKLADELATTRRQMELLTTKLREFELLELTRRDSYNQTCSRQSTDASHAYLPVSAPQLPSSTFLADCEETELQPSLNVSGTNVHLERRGADVCINLDDGPESCKSYDSVVDTSHRSTRSYAAGATAQVPISAASASPEGRSSRAMLRPLHRSKALKKNTVENILKAETLQADSV